MAGKNTVAEELKTAEKEVKYLEAYGDFLKGMALILGDLTLWDKSEDKNESVFERVSSQYADVVEQLMSNGKKKEIIRMPRTSKDVAEKRAAISKAAEFIKGFYTIEVFHRRSLDLTRDALNRMDRIIGDGEERDFVRLSKQSVQFVKSIFEQKKRRDGRK